MRSSTTLALLAAGLATAREVPANLKSFYEANINGNCPNAISIPYSSGQADADTVYCKDDASSAVYLKDITGSGYADADVDCDGAKNTDGDCKNDPSGQPQTAFKDLVKQFSNGAVNDLDAGKHTFVVFGNDNSPQEGDGGEKFDPQSAGIQPLSVIAVVCGDKLVYGVWGDINGGKVTGESSISLVKMCFPNEGITGNNGHGSHDVLYLAFPGEEAVATNAAWDASDASTFEASLAQVGDELVKKIGAGQLKSRVMRGKL